MILDTEITLTASSKIIGKLKSIGIIANYNDLITITIDKLWHNSNYKLNVKCDICGNTKKLSYASYNKNIKKYNIYTCNNSCSSIKNKMTNLERYNDENYCNKEKFGKTSLERYGTITPLLNNDIKKKSKMTKLLKYNDENYNNRVKFKETSLDRYGALNPLLNNDVKAKVKQTNLERYGVEDSRTSEYVKNKRKNTNIERYGVESYSNTDEYKAKIKKTSLDRYGVDSPNKVQFIKDKKVKSMLDKYGYISNSITKESKEILRNTNLERYGVEYPMQVLKFLEKQQKNSKKIVYYNEKLYYQSSYEKDFLDYLNNLDMLDLVERGPYIKYNYLGKSKRHYPDFYLHKFNLIIEIKSCYYYNKFLDINNAKMAECIKNGYNYIFIINKNYKLLDNIIENLSN